MAVTKIKPIKGTLSKALDYIQNPAKTDEKMLVSSFGCSYETADIEFGFTLSQALDKGNNLAHHLIQSFEPGEVDYREAHEIGRQLADAVKVSILYLFVFVSEKPCNQRLFSPLLRNKSTLFSHALGCLSAGNSLSAVRAIFDAV